MSTVLGKDAGKASPSEKDRKRASQARRKAARLLQAFNAWCFSGRRLTALNDGRTTEPERIARCGVRLRKRVGVKRLAEGNGRVSWTGIRTCGSVWSCLVCAPKIRARRAEEIDHLAKAHLAAGGSLTFLTFTLPHVATDSLDELLVAIDRAWRNAISGKGWHHGIKAEYGVIGQIKAVEATLGRHGWHPHLHVLFFHDKPCRGDDGTLEHFRDAIGDRWSARIERQLGRSVHDTYGVLALPVRDDDGLGAYVSKIHYELARSDLKQGDVDWNHRSPWQVGLDAARTGDAIDTARWAEWYWATKGRRAFSVSPILRERYGRTLSTDKSDEELAAERQAGEIEVWLSGRVYDALRQANRYRPALAEILIAFEEHGLMGLLREARSILGRALTLGDRRGTPVVSFTVARSDNRTHERRTDE